MKIGAISKNSGFTLIELLVALTITVLIVGVVTTSIFQVFVINAHSNSHLLAVKQVENAAHWISRDAQMAQVIEPGEDSGFPLNLSQIGKNNWYQVTYTLGGSELQRLYSVNGGDPIVTLVARFIDPEMTYCEFEGDVLIYKITAAVGDGLQESESRVCQVTPRPQ